MVEKFWQKLYRETGYVGGKNLINFGGKREIDRRIGYRRGTGRNSGPCFRHFAENEIRAAFGAGNVIGARSTPEIKQFRRPICSVLTMELLISSPRQREQRVADYFIPLPGTFHNIYHRENSTCFPIPSDFFLSPPEFLRRGKITIRVYVMRSQVQR